MFKNALRFWDFLGTASLCLGLIGFIPLDSDGALMMPGWVCLSLIVAAAFSELLFDAFIDRSDMSIRGQPLPEAAEVR